MAARKGIGRVMRAGRSLESNEFILSERFVVRGGCSVETCPGCGGPCSPDTDACAWATAERDPRLAAAIAWHRMVSARTLGQPAGADRVNAVRVCCLLALVIQAAADPPLLLWLLRHLRPAVASAELDPHAASTLSYSRLFAKYVPLAEAQIESLLRVLQTNLFGIDELAIGIFEAACLIEHSCRPNARVTVEPESGHLFVHSARPVAAGEALSFAYLDEEWLVTAAPGERRARLHAELGFRCGCNMCVAEEGG